MSNPILPSLTFITYSLGCRTNQAEMETICLQLAAYGYKQTDKNPNFILLNTCVVTQKAEKETRQKIRELRKKYPKCFLVILGCGVTAKEKFKIDLPEADLYISSEEKENAVKIILKNCHSDRTAVSGGIPFSQQLEAQTKVCYYNNKRKGSLDFARDDKLINKYIQSGRKFIKIQDGCNCGCSFCLTQFLRGKPTSVPPEKIIKEINYWVEKEIKEIILTGINIGLYGNNIDNRHSDQIPLSFRANPERSRRMSRGIPFSGSTKERDPSTRPLIASSVGMTITKLIRIILKETKIERISFSSIYPEMLTYDFIKLVVNNPRISQYFHLSLQSGSQTVLQRMSRKTNLKKLSDKLSWIKKQNPFFTFRADIISGFPDETEEEFKQTLEFIKKAKISFVHLFPFSRRQHTKSEAMLESKIWKEVPIKIKKERQKILLETVEKIRIEEAKYLIAKLPARRNFSEGGLNCLIVRKIPCRPDYKRGLKSPLWGLKSAITEKQERDPPPDFACDLPASARRWQAGRTRWRAGSTSVEMTQWEGITENGWPIKISIKYQVLSIKYGYLGIKGKILTAKIIGFEKDYLLGEIG